MDIIESQLHIVEMQGYIQLTANELKKEDPENAEDIINKNTNVSKESTDKPIR